MKDMIARKHLNLIVDYRQFIESHPEKRFGRPCVKGTRISVSDVLNWIANGMSHKQILSDYPELTETDIEACLAFDADQRKEK